MKQKSFKLEPKRTTGKSRSKTTAKEKVILSRLFLKNKRRNKKRKRRAVGKGPLTLKKPLHNPIISPRPENDWESWQTFNPGVIHLDDKIHFLYRAIGKDGISRLGYANSADKFSVSERPSSPVFEHQITGKRSFNVFSYFSGGSWGGAEDPRLVRVDNEDVLYMTYTACIGDLRVGLTSIKVADFLNKKWKWKTPVLLSPPGEVHKNWVIFPRKINGRYAILHSLNPEVSVEYLDSLDFDGTSPAAYISSCHGNQPRKNCWDKWIRGTGPVPLETKYGWLVFYHAMDNDWSQYKVGAMLLDLEAPTKVLYRAKAPVLAPDQFYENNGFKAGVVYASGAVIKDGELLVYYGSADSYVCVAYTDFDEFTGALIKHKEPKLKTAVVKANRHVG